MRDKDIRLLEKQYQQILNNKILLDKSIDGPTSDELEAFDDYKQDIEILSSILEIDNFGNKRWKNKEGYNHRVGGPAYEGINGTKAWWINGTRHREDGPAVECPDGTFEWYLFDNRYNDEEDWKKAKKELGLKESTDELTPDDLNAFDDYGKAIEDLDSTMTVDKEGNKIWRNKEGQLHRKNGPAAEYSDGIKSWRFNGKRHREDGPAREWPDGSKEWWINGKLHREDGPAIEWADGTKEWYLNDKIYYNEKAWKKAKKQLGLKESTDDS